MNEPFAPARVTIRLMDDEAGFLPHSALPCWVCTRCSALVDNPIAHSHWHDAIEPQGRDEP